MERKNQLIKINHLLIACLILAQPFIVMFQATVVRDVQLFGFSIFEFYNIFLAVISMGLSIYTYPKKKTFIKFVPYLILLGVYTILHGINIYHFDQSIYSYQSPNFLVESYYIFRTFMVPLLLIFDIYYSQIEKEKLYQILETFIFIVSLVMVITNIFCIAQRSYSEEVVYNTLNIFDWFTFDNMYKYSYYDLTTKGWFLSANQMSAILFISLPVMLYRAYRKRDGIHYILIILQMLAMFMLGTRTANMGSLLVLITFIILWVFFKILKQTKQGILFFLVTLLLFGLLFPYSPLGYKFSYGHEKKGEESSNGASMLDNAINVKVNQENSTFDYEKLIRDSNIFKTLDAQNLTLDQQAFVISYMEEFCGFFGISPYIIEHYNDLGHSAFWTHYLQETPNNDYRVLKTMILEDIYEHNHNPMDKYLGLGYTLNYIYTEADYSYQLYSYGIVGTLLLIGPYFYLLLYVIYQGLRNFKEMFTFECSLYFIGPLLGIVAAKFSGHVFERPFPLIIMALLLGILLIHTREQIVKKEWAVK